MEHMFDWLYKQANLQSMCSITCLATPSEYQRASAKPERRGWASCLPPPVEGHGPGAPAGPEPRGSCSQRHLWPPLESLRVFSFWGPVSPGQRGKEEKKNQQQFPAGSGLWCKARCGIKDRTLLCCTGMSRMRPRQPPCQTDRAPCPLPHGKNVNTNNAAFPTS